MKEHKEIMIKERLKQFLELRLQDTDTINARMEMELQEISIEESYVVLKFPVSQWQLNPKGHLHGGMICTALDITMGCAAYIFSNAEFTPTIQLAVNFDKGIRQGEQLLIKGYCDHAGTRMAQTRAIAYLTDGSIVASANGSYAVNGPRK